MLFLKDRWKCDIGVVSYSVYREFLRKKIERLNCEFKS